MHDKYSDLNIWNDFVHIDINVNSTVYYEDISREVLRGIKTHLLKLIDFILLKKRRVLLNVNSKEQV